MGNKTLIPALKAHVGDWHYYICVMKYAQVAKEFSFAYELGGNEDLNQLIQRGIGARTKDITEYLLKSEHRFLGSLIVAAWGGDPEYYPVNMDESDEFTKGLDSGFGVLTFDGSQQYFALDGQHRLKAIKDAVKKNPELGSEEISVILVSHFNTPEGQERTRRLFSNINKNAKATSVSEDIALDEDDAYAIITRRLINEHEILSGEGRVCVFRKIGDAGELSIATSVADSNKRAVTSIKQLYEMVKYLSFSTDIDGVSKNIRPKEEYLESSYNIISGRLNQLFDKCGDVTGLIDKNDDLRQFRKNKTSFANEHAFLKGIIQKSIVKVLSELVGAERISWESALEQLSSLNWSLTSAPWSSVVSVLENTRKMQTNRDFANLLEHMLIAHLAPNSKQAIKRARTEYKQLKGHEYPVSEVELVERLHQAESGK